MCNHSHNVARFCNQLDYVGILLLMWGAGIPSTYYGFVCHPRLQSFYWILSTSAALCCAPFILSTRFVLPQFRRWRVVFFAAFGFSSLIFVIHGAILYGRALQMTYMSLVPVLYMATINLAGAVIYVSRIPERWFPNKFDLFGASHQIFHLAVIVAAWVHFRGIAAAFVAVRSQGVVCSAD
ncbi:Hly-III-related protein [Akanthomyces lecanii RCEF 1005]|uniref:Hly-III-related protein n=1 Tax=Akanthomyces lecanii RCEF 1005 TaxID=1081108 RepID=A0A162J3E4_CORDF|nr:Hly-III-related protein [Akanthomyces lecanii RCEF 1005]